MTHQIKWDNGGVFVECSGNLTIQDIHIANGLLQGDERFEKHQFQVWNLIKSNLSQITLEEMKEPAAIDLVASAYTKNVKVALVVQESHAVSLISAYCEQCNQDNSTWQSQYFSHLADAIKWATQ
jgi:hypothetical protein